MDALPPPNGKAIVFVVADCLSKYAHFIPLSHPYTAVRVAHALVDKVFRLHDMPSTLCL